MNVISLEPLIPTSKNIAIINGIPSQQQINLVCNGDIKQIDEQLNFLITVNITIEIPEPHRLLRLETQHTFKIKLSTKDVSIKTENDVWVMTDLTVVSMAQARLLLMQAYQKNSIQSKVLPIEPIGKVFHQIKEGHFALWN
ncbi:hypothetical protein [Mucilaginibacter sp. 22184]|uniref:hypothetical protein n=1 Tax=Mucilaginibacter sp. 22184 TaxID=3453887 RepID=UPI003F837CBC